MRKLKFCVVAAFLALLSSCADIYPPYIKENYFANYNVFRENGIYIYESLSPAIQYQTLGRLYYEEKTGCLDLEKTKRDLDIKKEETILTVRKKKSTNSKRNTLLIVDYATFCKDVCEEVKKRGGDGIIGFNIEYTPSDLYKGEKIFELPEKFPGYTVTGVIIKKQ